MRFLAESLWANTEEDAKRQVEKLAGGNAGLLEEILSKRLRRFTSGHRGENTPALGNWV